jgi:uncharacterized alpha-E superfamily protein
MLSRVAENIFWMSRYMERSNMQLRILRTYYIASQDGVPFVKWDDVFRYYNQGIPAEKSLTANEVLNFILFDKDNESSVVNNIFKARENARSAQDHITKELWQCLNDYYHLIRDKSLQRQLYSGDPVSTLDQLVKQCMLYYGIVDISMFRSEGFNYLNTGKYLERLLQSIDALAMQISRTNGSIKDSMDIVSWRYFLVSISGYEYYLKSNSGTVNPGLIFKQVLYEMHFPHSIAYSIAQLDRYAQRLKPESLEESYDKLEFSIGKAAAILKYNSPGTDIGAQLALLQSVESNLLNVVQVFNEYYFGVTA